MLRSSTRHIPLVVYGKSACSLEKFTTDCCERYSVTLDGPGQEHFYLDNALLRRFAINNPDLLHRGEDYAEPEPSTNKRKAAGRPPGGQDWWSEVDAWFAAEIALRGRQLTGDGWKECFLWLAVPHRTPFRFRGGGVCLAAVEDSEGSPPMPFTLTLTVCTRTLGPTFLIPSLDFLTPLQVCPPTTTSEGKSFFRYSP
ncbi:hypothetical protein DFP72DRAFT_1065599 [Ephemerocybe angulata]|uniref:Uncharacterized protein n=1 Tax=Ephemerocybe angulata TaxID=980116 RepID=A0A8H6M9F1_9AGAR|nr:hypothetical protein DFP72DRAFT_1065599 [Tulosesus angulatus]